MLSARGTHSGALLHVRASPPFSPCCRSGRQFAGTGNGLFQTAPAPARLAKLRLDSISPSLFLLQRQAQPARSSSSRQACRNTAHPRRLRGRSVPVVPGSRPGCSALLRCGSLPPPHLQPWSAACLPQHHAAGSTQTSSPSSPSAGNPAELLQPSSSAGAIRDLRRGERGGTRHAVPAFGVPGGSPYSPSRTEKEGAESSASQLPWPRSTGGQSQGQNTACLPCCNPIPHGPGPPGTFWTKMKPRALYRVGVGTGAHYFLSQLSRLQ